jgi:PPK2 family polyphosphate:nucleotide phosphotransferase
MEKYRVQPGAKINLKDFAPDDLGDFKDKKEAGKTRTMELLAELEKLQDVLYAEQKHKVMIVLQAMDTGGKDGTIRSIFQGINPQGVRVASFKAPTPEELSHDYLWRIHQQTPGKGEIVIFNRSHYEDVLVVRVHNLVPREVWARRYHHICEFERTLAEEGTVILKFFLHISAEEQRRRLLERLDIPEKRWKFNPGDLEERKFWDDYMQAYEEALNRTSAAHAPWYIVPSDRNWYRNLVVASVIVDALKKLKMSYPNPVENIEQYRTQLGEK